MIKETRVNIGPLAKQIRTEGPLITPKYADFATMKPEFEALTAVLIDRVVTCAYEERDTRIQSAIVLSAGGDDTFTVLEKIMTQDIGSSANRLQRQIENETVDPELISTYIRFSDLLKERAEMDPEIGQHTTLLSSLLGGIQTATLMMSESLGLINVLGEGKSPEELVGIAKRSYPLIVNIAAMNLEHFIFAGEVLQPLDSEDDSFGFIHLSPYKFALIGDPGRERLEITPEASEEIEGLIEKSGELTVPTTGCPGLVNFGTGSAIRKLWDWHLELAEIIFPKIAAVPPNQNGVAATDQFFPWH